MSWARCYQGSMDSSQRLSLVLLDTHQRLGCRLCLAVLGCSDGRCDREEVWLIVMLVVIVMVVVLALVVTHCAACLCCCTQNIGCRPKYTADRRRFDDFDLSRTPDQSSTHGTVARLWW